MVETTDLHRVRATLDENLDLVNTTINGERTSLEKQLEILEAARYRELEDVLVKKLVSWRNLLERRQDGLDSLEADEAMTLEKAQEMVDWYEKKYTKKRAKYLEPLKSTIERRYKEAQFTLRNNRSLVNSIEAGVVIRDNKDTSEYEVIIAVRPTMKKVEKPKEALTEEFYCSVRDAINLIATDVEESTYRGEFVMFKVRYGTVKGDAEVIQGRECEFMQEAIKLETEGMLPDPNLKLRIINVTNYFTRES